METLRRVLGGIALALAALGAVGVFMEQGLGRACFAVVMFCLGMLVGDAFQPWRRR